MPSQRRRCRRRRARPRRRRRAGPRLRPGGHPGQARLALRRSKRPARIGRDDLLAVEVPEVRPQRRCLAGHRPTGELTGREERGTGATWCDRPGRATGNRRASAQRRTAAHRARTPQPCAARPCQGSDELVDRPAHTTPPRLLPYPRTHVTNRRWRSPRQTRPGVVVIRPRYRARAVEVAAVTALLHQASREVRRARLGSQRHAHGRRRSRRDRRGHVSTGLPSYHVVGLPDAAVRESRGAVRGAVVVTPRVPAAADHGQPRAGWGSQDQAGFELAVALGLIAATGQLADGCSTRSACSASWARRISPPVPGVLALVGALRAAGRAR